MHASCALFVLPDIAECWKYTAHHIINTASVFSLWSMVASITNRPSEMMMENRRSR